MQINFECKASILNTLTKLGIKHKALMHIELTQYCVFSEKGWLFVNYKGPAWVNSYKLNENLKEPIIYLSVEVNDHSIDIVSEDNFHLQESEIRIEFINE